MSTPQANQAWYLSDRLDWSGAQQETVDAVTLSGSLVLNRSAQVPVSSRVRCLGDAAERRKVVPTPPPPRSSDEFLIAPKLRRPFDCIHFSNLRS